MAEVFELLQKTILRRSVFFRLQDQAGDLVAVFIKKSLYAFEIVVAEFNVRSCIALGMPADIAVVPINQSSTEKNG